MGDSRNRIRQIIGGAFGDGTISRIVRGYTFISRNYEPGDKIVVIGFSRGAYTARALAGLIANLGVLGKEHTADKEKAYRKGAQAWFRYRETVMPRKDRPLLASFAEAISDLPAFLSKNSLDSADFVPVPSIAAVAVWDTVGAMGLPSFLGPKTDAFAFVNNALSTKVKVGLHFQPKPPFTLKPDHAAPAHQPWDSPPWNFGSKRTQVRQFAPTAGLQVHPSVHGRRTWDGGVCSSPGCQATPYNPANLAAILG